MRFAIAVVLILGAHALAGDARIDEQGRVIRKWPGGVWSDGKDYPAGSFEYIDTNSRVIGPVGSAGASGISAGVSTSTSSGSALDEVNATRAQRGLRPFILDPALAQGAQAAANYRAANRMEGHTSNDFAFLPPGSSAAAGGCAAWSPSMGWGACCTYDNYTYAGAGWAYGLDGRRYMHLFVR